MSGSTDAEYPQRLNLSMNLENFQAIIKQYICILSGCFGDNFRRNTELDPSEGENDLKRKRNYVK